MQVCNSHSISKASVGLQSHLSDTLEALLVYEYIITIDQELSAIWRRKFNVASLLFITVRWTMLFNGALLSTPASPHVSDRDYSRRPLVNLHDPVLGVRDLQEVSPIKRHSHNPPTAALAPCP